MSNLKQQARLLWCDAEANSIQLSTRKGVAEVVRKASRAGINTIIVDVKPLSGEVLYLSEIAPRLKEVKGHSYPQSFDLLQTMIEEGHAAGIPVHACINIFSEGHRKWNRGPAYSQPEWQVITYEGGNPPKFSLMQDSRHETFGVFVNPIGPAREYELRIIREIVHRYNIDGIVFDRMRYPNLYGDFSSLSKTTFEKWIGISNLRWPDDIFIISDDERIIRGPYYKEWLEWRAWQIKDFARDAVHLARSINPKIKIGVYVGSWYDTYFNVGVNWGSENFHPGYEWMTADYNKTGFAELFDYICTGCYYPDVTREEARSAKGNENLSVEASCQLSMKAISGASNVYGSLYLLDYKQKPDKFRSAVDMVLCNTQGIMFFDLVYIEDYGWWQILEEVFIDDAIPPHDAND